MEGEYRMETLAVKDIEFNGAMLKAAQDINNIIWVGVRWICEGLGLSEGQIKRERKRLQEDLVLSKGGRNLVLLTNGGNQEVSCLQLDYLPLWLAKISITPAMKKENPELVQNLIKYQLKAKDVLAEAFIKEKLPVQVTPQQQAIQLTFPAYETQLNELNQKMDKLYHDMGKFVQVMLEWKESVGSPKNLIDDAVNTYTGIMDNLSAGGVVSGCRDWKGHMYDLMDKLIKVDARFKNKAAILTCIYKYMNKNYGISWTQEIKDYKEKYNCSTKPSTIDVVYDKDMYRSIFESVLVDLVSNTDAIKIADVDKLDQIIRPLIEKRNDKSLHGSATYRRIYSHMENNYKVDWKNHITRYKREHSTTKAPTKKKLILGKSSLIKKFENSVDDMIKQY